MLFYYLTRKFGGYWGLRQRIRNSKNKYTNKFYKLVLKGVQHETNSFMPYYNEMAGRPTLPHGMYGIFISSRAKIGRNATIFHQVTIGSNTFPDSKQMGSPIIGDNCFIGAGAKIIGGITIGNNCRIGANAVVSKNLPDNSVIVMGSPRIFEGKVDKNNFYFNTERGWGYNVDGQFVVETDIKIISLLDNMDE